jgi:hypothetical protein
MAMLKTDLPPFLIAGDPVTFIVRKVNDRPSTHIEGSSFANREAVRGVSVTL